VKEFFNNILSKHIPCASVAKAETLHIHFRIRPHQICKRPFMRDLLNSSYRFNIIYILQTGRKASMNTEYSRVNRGCYRQKIKQVCEQLPYYRTSVFPLALSKESIHLSCLSSLMIASKQSKSIWVSKF